MAPAAAPAPATQGWANGVPLSVTPSAAPPARPASVVSAVTNATRGTTGGSRLISNSEILDLLSAAQDNGGGTSTLLFATVAELEEPSDHDASIKSHGTDTAGFSSGFATQPDLNELNGREDSQPPNPRNPDCTL